MSTIKKTLQEFKIANIGPIERLSIPLPEDGGVVVLTGCQGSGKSTALRAIQATAGGVKADLQLRDGASRGAVEFAGARLSVTKSRSSRTGELAVETIEGRYDIGALVDPQIKDPERADAARIKQLLALTGAVADTAPYIKLIGQERWDSLDIDAATDCPIELWSRVVRALQAAARAAEKTAAELRVDVSELGITDEECDNVPTRDEMHELVLAAERELSELQARQKQAAEFAASHQAAMDRLKVLELEYKGVTAERAQAAYDDAANKVSRLEDELTAAREALRLAVSVYRDARQHEESMAEFRAIVAASAPSTVSAELVAEAMQARDEARRRSDEAAMRRAAATTFARAREANAKADKFAASGERYRTLATDAETLLGTILPKSDIRVIEGRLVCKTDRSNNELYADLSHGERAILAIRTAAKYIPEGGVATISQEMWGGISEENRRLIADEARSHGVTIITAQVTDEPLGVEVL